jgi:hypothetical protein
VNSYQPAGHSGIDYPVNLYDLNGWDDDPAERMRRKRNRDHEAALLEDAIRDGLKSEGLEVVETLMGGAL